MRNFKPLPVWKVLVGALTGDLKRVFIVGVDGKGDIYAAGSHFYGDHMADVAEFQRKVRRGDYDDPEKIARAKAA